MKEKRKKEVKKRKSFLLTLVIIISLWLLLVFMILFVNPEDFGAIGIFFVLVFLAIFFTLSTIFENTRRGLIFSVSLIIFLILRYFGVGNILNLLLIAGVAIASEIYFWYSRDQ